MSYMNAVAARTIKSVKLTSSIAVLTDGLVKNQFWLVVTKFKVRVLNPFQRQNMKKNLFLDKKLRGLLLARTPLKKYGLREAGAKYISGSLC